VMTMSGVSTENVTDVLRALRDQIDADKLRHRVAEAEDEEDEDAPWQP